MSIPTLFRQEDYDDWIESMAKDEAKEIHDNFEDWEVDDSKVRQFVEHSGNLMFYRADTLDAYYDVVEYGHHGGQTRTIELPDEDPVSAMTGVMRSIVRRDLVAETISQLEELEVQMA